METRFQIPELPNPTIHDVQDWIRRVNLCARQKDLKGAGVGPPDVKKFNQPWDPEDVRRIQSLLEQFGFLKAGVDDMDHLAFREIWGYVKRLEELLSKIEGSATLGEEMKRRLRENKEPLQASASRRRIGRTQVGTLIS